MRREREKVKRQESGHSTALQIPWSRRLLALETIVNWLDKQQVPYMIYKKKTSTGNIFSNIAESFPIS